MQSITFNSQINSIILQNNLEVVVVNARDSKYYQVLLILMSKWNYTKWHCCINVVNASVLSVTINYQLQLCNGIIDMVIIWFKLQMENKLFWEGHKSDWVVILLKFESLQKNDQVATELWISMGIDWDDFISCTMIHIFGF